MRNTLSLCLILAIGSLHAQSNDVLAKAAFLKAQELYGNAQYDDAAAKLNDVVSLLGSTNPRIEYLKVQCYYELKNAEEAQKAIAAYFKVAADDDPNYMTMLTRVEDVKSMAALMAKSVRLEYNLKVGQSFEISSNMNSEVIQNGSTNSSSSMNSSGRYTVLAVNGNDYQMKYEIVSSTFPVQIPSVVGEALRGKSFEFTMTKTGAVSNVQGIDEMINLAGATIDNTKMKSANRNLAKTTLASLADPNSWKSNLEDLTPHTSETIYPGKEWTKLERMSSSGYSEVVPVLYKLESITGSTAKISFSAAFEPGATFNKNEIKGSQSGLLTIDLTTGFLISGNRLIQDELIGIAPLNKMSEVSLMAARVAPTTSSAPSVFYSSKTTTTFRRN